MYSRWLEVLLKQAADAAFLFVYSFGITHKQKPELVADQITNVLVYGFFVPACHETFQVLKTWKVLSSRPTRILLHTPNHKTTPHILLNLMQF